MKKFESLDYSNTDQRRLLLVKERQRIRDELFFRFIAREVVNLLSVLGRNFGISRPQHGLMFEHHRAEVVGVSERNIEAPGRILLRLQHMRDWYETMTDQVTK